MAKTLKDRIGEAGAALSDLNVFYGVISLLEGGSLSANSNQDAQRIIAICKSAGGKCLRRMDDAVADATRRYAADEQNGRDCGKEE